MRIALILPTTSLATRYGIRFSAALQNALQLGMKTTQSLRPGQRDRRLGLAPPDTRTAILAITGPLQQLSIFEATRSCRNVVRQMLEQTEAC